MKVSPDYNMCVAIPLGTKCYAWITYYGSSGDACIILEINKNKKICKATWVPIRYSDFCCGTLLYGTFGRGAFIIEDICLYKGISTKTCLLSEKMGFIESFIRNFVSDGSIQFYLAVCWGVQKADSYDCLYDIPKKYVENYPIHHIQYRCLNKVAPYMNIFPVKKGFTSKKPDLANAIQEIPFRFFNFAKPQYKNTAVFRVMADIQFDIYRLYAYGKTPVFYNVAYIPNYRTSVFMNGIFRNIKENANLDAIEESDDEEDFENIDPEKYVDLTKTVLMECQFYQKFKKWVPLRVVAGTQKVVHISLL